jgi:RND family efflux transporter MFP subunit
VVTVAKPRLGDANNALTLPATVYGLHEASLYARVNGYISRIDVDMGARVREGQTLAVIDMPEVEQELQAARAAVEQGEASGALARATLSRWRSMVDQTAATRQEFEEKQAAFNVSEASVKAARANVERLTALRRFGSITAPFSGVVTARNVDVGALVAPGSGSTVRPLFTLAQTDRLRVITSVPQNAAPTVRVGQDADVVVQELGNVAFRGRVTRTSRALDYATRTLQTEIQLDNRDGRLMPGMFAQVRLELPRGTRTLLIPANTLMVRPDGPQVAIVRDGRIVIASVTLGRDFGSELEVLGGVTVNDSLVINPGDDVPKGTVVRVARPVAADSGARP